MWAAFLIALIPLVWILGTVVIKGGQLLLDSHWWTNSQRGITARHVGGGAVHAIQRHARSSALATAVIAVPIGILTAIYLVEYGRGTLARAVSFMVDILTGVPSIVAALFIYAVWVTTFGFQRVGFAGLPRPGAADDPGGRPLHRGDAQAGARTSCARRRTRWACRSGRRSSRSCCRRRSRASSPASLLGLARVMGETAPLLILGPYTKAIATDLFSGLHADAADDDQHRPAAGACSRPSTACGPPRSP